MVGGHGRRQNYRASWCAGGAPPTVTFLIVLVEWSKEYRFAEVGSGSKSALEIKL